MADGSESELVTAKDIAIALSRFERRFHSIIVPALSLMNEDALRNGDRLVSIYQSVRDQKFYIITEWDRSVTTVLLPEDY